MGVGLSGLRITNRGSSGPALVMAMLLDLPKPSPPAPHLKGSPETAPTPAPVRSFEGDWKGYWDDDKIGREGSFRLKIEKDGAASGRFSYPSFKITGSFTGTVAPDGAVQLETTSSKRKCVLTGTLKFSEDAPQEVVARLSISSDDEVLGGAGIVLEKQEN
jgi:hypothetical protein